MKSKNSNNDIGQTHEAAEPIRVTDRRRIHMFEDADNQERDTIEAPQLKPKYVEELEARTKAAEKLVQEVQGRFEQLRQQLQRETDETRQRLNRAADERAEREKINFIASLLPVMDNLSYAIDAAKSENSLQTVFEGVTSTLAGFENALTQAGVEPIDAIGQSFDPQLHEAVDTVEVRPEDDGKVIAEYSRGFKIGDRLLRPARVKVGRARPESKEAFQ